MIEIEAIIVIIYAYFMIKGISLLIQECKVAWSKPKDDDDEKRLKWR